MANRVLDTIIPLVYKNVDRLKNVQIRHNKLSSHPKVLVLGEDGCEIVTQISYLSDSIVISTNAEVYYEVYLY